jgi:hypothetical protein
MKLPDNFTDVIESQCERLHKNREQLPKSVPHENEASVAAHHVHW